MSGKIRVLFVDDEEQFTKNMARILRSRDFEVTIAFDGYQAIEAVKYGGGFDVVVLDVKMPGMDGVETLREIKKRAPDTEVIMLTGHATLASGSQAMRSGAYDYLMKPCDIEDLVEKIREAYEAEEIRRHPVLWPRKLVREIVLHDFERLAPDDPPEKALDMMSRGTGEEAVEEVYVLDPQNRLLGWVTKRELLNEAQKAHPDETLDWNLLLADSGLLPRTHVRELMRPDPISTQANAYLTDAANQMIINNVRRMPVLRAEKMIGVIKLQDVFQYLDQEME